MSKNKILDKIKSGKVKMKPRWEFEIKKWSEVGIWISMIGLMVSGVVSIAYFLTIYNLSELSQFGDLGWQIFYEDFPYIWGVVAIFSLITGIFVMMNSGENYKRSWQKNLMIFTGVVLILTILTLFLKH
jgi:hypothetical protein